MRAFVVKENAHPSKIALSTDAPTPTMGPGQVLIDIYSAGLNFFDILQSQGKYQVQPPHPFTLGTEFAGRIAQNSPIPKGCPYRPGDRVFGATQGSYADQVAINWDTLIPLPKKHDFR